MAFTYASDLSTNLARVRLAIGDTVNASVTAGAGCRPDGSNYTDAELNAYITDAGTWYGAVAPVLRTLAHEYARQARSTGVAGLSESLGGIASELQTMAEKWDNAYGTGMPTSEVLVGFTSETEDGTELPYPFGASQWGLKLEDNVG